MLLWLLRSEVRRMLAWASMLLKRRETSAAVADDIETSRMNSRVHGLSVLVARVVLRHGVARRSGFGPMWMTRQVVKR